MRIDLHTHTTASDGTDSPSELLAAAFAADLDVIALTDHDTTAGWAPAEQALGRFPGLRLIRGAELSCVADGIPLHLLAYLFDPGLAELATEMALTRDDRIPRAQEMVRRMAAEGIPIEWEGVLATLPAGATVGRPHLADALVAGGVAKSRDEAFSRWLHSSSPFYVAHHSMHPVHAVQLVRRAGGVVVFAHPRATRRGRIVPDALIEQLAQAGLAALEVDHRDQDESDRAHLRSLASELGLLITGASDYHGSGKQNRLGENSTSPEALDALLTGVTSGLPPLPA